MLQSVQTVATQIFIMFLLMFVGSMLYHKKIIDNEGSRQISSLLLNVVTPAVLISSFQREFNLSDFKDLGLAFFFAALTYLFPIVLMRLLYGKSKLSYARDAQMCVIFSNNGFMAIPLLQALLGAKGVFLGSASIVVGTVIVWTYGVRLLSGEAKVNVRKIFLNPGTLALAGGLLLFVSPVKLPQPIFQAVSYLGGLNTPLAMIVLGIFLAQSHVFACLKEKTIYWISFLKLIAVPLCMLLLFTVFGVRRDVAMALLIATAAPTGVVTTMFAQTHQTDHLFSTRIVAVTTLLSAITLPLCISLGEWIWR